MSNSEKPRIASDIDIHRRLTYFWLRRALVIVTSFFLCSILVYRFTLDQHLDKSISAYYYNSNNLWPMRDLFVGSLMALGVLLIVYHGHRDAENRALDVGGLALIGVAFFPMRPPAGVGEHLHSAWVGGWVQWVHYGCAATFFLSIAYVAWFHARDTLEDIKDETNKKGYRLAYALVGLLMALVGVFFLSCFVAEQFNLAVVSDSYVLWGEFGGVVAFWAYWSVKTYELEMSKIDLKKQADVKSAQQSPGEKPVY